MQRGKNPPGPNGRSIRDIADNCADIMNRLCKEIANGSYTPGVCTVHTIQQPTGKVRQIVRLNLEDKWLQRVIQDILSDLLETYLPVSCMAYRKGNGPIEACKAIQRFMQSGYKHYLKTDVVDYFPSIDLARLSCQLKAVSDQETADIVMRVIQPAYISEQGESLTIRGLPLGFPLSPILSNLYLMDLDKVMSSVNETYIRFSDDIIMMGQAADQLRKELTNLENMLAGFGLNLKKRKTRIAMIRGGVYYLGHLVKKDRIFEKRSEKMISTDSDGNIRTTKDDDLPALQAMSPEGRVLEEALGNIASIEKPTGQIGEQLIAFDGTTPQETISLQRLGCRVFLRTLYLSSYRMIVRVDNQNAVICQGENRETIPLRKINQVVVLGRVYMTMAFQVACLARRIPIVFVSQRGRYLGLLSAAHTRNTELIKNQASRSDDCAFRLKVACAIVKGKMASQAAFLESRRNPHHEIRSAAVQIRRQMTKLESDLSIQNLMGQEGYSTRIYFAALAKLFKGRLAFTARKRRPPTDPVNAMLSFGYTLLHNDIQAILLAHSLDVGFGFLHESNFGRPSLVMDLIEELRSPVIDRLVLRVVNTGIFQPDHFQRPEGESGPCYLLPEHRRRYIEEYEKAMSMTYRHRATGLQLDVRRVISVQAVCIKKTIKGSLPNYIPAELF